MPLPPRSVRSHARSPVKSLRQLQGHLIDPDIPSRQDGRRQGPTRDEADRTSKTRRVERRIPRTGVRRPGSLARTTIYQSYRRLSKHTPSIRSNALSLYNLLCTMPAFAINLNLKLALVSRSKKLSPASFPRPRLTATLPRNLIKTLDQLRGSQGRADRKGSSSSFSLPLLPATFPSFSLLPPLSSFSLLTMIPLSPPGVLLVAHRRAPSRR
jgi:hypothetical protein